MTSTADAVPVGRRPVQARARARVDAILDAAAEQLAETGPPLNLTDTAQRAGVPIGSLYQYFPAHSSLIHALAERHLATVGDRIVDDVATAGLDDRTVEGALRAYLAVADDPLQVAIMRAIRADDALRHLDQADTTRNVDALVEALRDSGRPVTPRMRDRIELVIELAGELALVLSTRAPADRERLTEAFVALATGPS